METKASPLPVPSPSNHTVDGEKVSHPTVRIASYGANFAGRHDDMQVTISGLSSHEFDLVEGAVHGHQWVSVSHLGRLRAIPTYKELPAPADDEAMQPFWRPPMTGVETQLEMFEFAPLADFCLPSIIVQSLCGYNYSPNKYRSEAAKLQRWGFECLRSRRDVSGRYHEMWVLESVYAAQDDLKRAVDAIKQGGKDHARRQVEAAINFLCHNASFGTLDVSAQRAAMVID